MTVQSPHVGFVRGRILEVNRERGYVLFDQTNGMGGDPIRISVTRDQQIWSHGLWLPKWLAKKWGLLWTDQCPVGN